GFDIHEALEKCSEFIEQFGGHKYAAGLTVAKDKFELFRNKFEEVVKNTITEESLSPEINIDSEINFSYINPKFIRILKQFEPCFFQAEDGIRVFHVTGVQTCALPI